MPEPQNLPVWMVRETLDGLPEFALPKGYTLRWYHPGDEAVWLKIHLLTDRFNTFAPDTFAKIFGNDPVTLGRRQMYICDAGEQPIATATAWFDDDFHGKSYGRIHWVAVLPKYQGHGFGKLMLSVACRRLRELGHERAYLKTSTGRLAAIHIYQSFGFKPFLRDPSEAALWRDIRVALAAARRTASA